MVCSSLALNWSVSLWSTGSALSTGSHSISLSLSSSYLSLCCFNLFLQSISAYSTICFPFRNPPISLCNSCISDYNYSILAATYSAS
jgi:hypothetical protein